MTPQAREQRARVNTWSVPWQQVLVALGISLAGTVVLGSLLFLSLQNVWWIAIAGLVSLFCGGFYISRASGVSEPFFGTLLAILYYAVVVGILFGGTLTEILPEPLPGLGVGDSTFFFVWPLLQLAAAVSGNAAGRLQPLRKEHEK